MLTILLGIDRSKQPKRAVTRHLEDASYSPDTGFGRLVKFRNPAGATLNSSKSSEKSSQESSFKSIPRTETQGFDMNLLEVSETKTQVLVVSADIRDIDYCLEFHSSSRLFESLSLSDAAVLHCTFLSLFPKPC